MSHRPEQRADKRSRRRGDSVPKGMPMGCRCPYCPRPLRHPSISIATDRIFFGNQFGGPGSLVLSIILSSLSMLLSLSSLSLSWVSFPTPQENNWAAHSSTLNWLPKLKRTAKVFGNLTRQNDVGKSRHQAGLFLEWWTHQQKNGCWNWKEIPISHRGRPSNPFNPFIQPLHSTPSFNPFNPFNQLENPCPWASAEVPMTPGNKRRVFGTQEWSRPFMVFSSQRRDPRDGCWTKNKGKTPKWMVKIRENPIKIDDLGCKKPYFWKHPDT